MIAILFNPLQTYRTLLALFIIGLCGVFFIFYQMIFYPPLQVDQILFYAGLASSAGALSELMKKPLDDIDEKVSRIILAFLLFFGLLSILIALVLSLI